MLSSLTLHAAPECTIWALAGAVSDRVDTHTERQATRKHTPTRTNRKGEKPHCVFSNIFAAEKKKKKKVTVLWVYV